MAILFSLWFWIIALASIVLFIGVKWASRRQRKQFASVTFKPKKQHAFPGGLEQVKSNELLDETESLVIKPVDRHIGSQEDEAVEELVVKPVGDTLNLLDEEVQERVRVAKAVPPVLVLYVLAQPNSRFHGYELQQVLSNQDLHFGDMNIFHRLSADGTEKPIFSVAQASEPGTFDIDKMGTLSCVGLCLLMQPQGDEDDVIIFNEMFDTALALADELYAEVFDDKKNPLTEDTRQQYLDLLNTSLNDDESLHQNLKHSQVI